MSSDLGMFDHQDELAVVDHILPLDEKLAAIHRTLRQRLPCIHRIAVVLYDDKTDLLKTFVHSSDSAHPLTQYQATLGQSGSLREIIQQQRPRVVNDLALFRDGSQPHTSHIQQEGYAASYTLPMYVRGAFFGFVFFNSYQRNAFTRENLQLLDPYGHLVALSVINDLNAMKTMLSTVNAARSISHLRDDETGSHQDRMSRYARLIAMQLAPRFGFSDEYIENVFIFAPLHDIGKIGIPDAILFKPGQLTENEYAEMKTHTLKGRQLVDQLLASFQLDSQPHIDILRNIAELHHEAMDGSGYPYGRHGEDIPIEARITTVADVFDALTSRRPYKEAWSNEQAFAMLQQLRGIKFDADCVDALLACQEQIEHIQRHFQEDAIG